MSSTAVTVEEVIKYNNENWTLQAAENEHGGITYTLYAFPKAGGTNWILTNFDTGELAALKKLVDTALSNAHSDREKLLS